MSIIAPPRGICTKKMVVYPTMVSSEGVGIQPGGNRR